MRTLGAAFDAEREALRRNLEHQLDSFYIDIVDNIAATMKNATPKVTKTQLAARMGVSPARVTNLLRGYKPNLELRTLVQIAIALDVEPHTLCARRKTQEMLKRPLHCISAEYSPAMITEDKDGKHQAA